MSSEGKWGPMRMAETNVTHMSERNHPERSAWLDPRFLVSLLVLLGGLFGIYVASERRAATMELSVNEMKVMQAQMASSVTTMTTTVVRLQTERESDRRDIEDLKRAMELLQTYNVSITNKLAKIEAKLEK